MILGFKIYLEPSMSDVLNNKMNILIGGCSFFMGCMLFMNYLSLLSTLQNPGYSFFSKIKNILNFVFFNYNFGIINFTSDSNFISNYYGESSITSIIITIYITLNTLPLLFNPILNYKFQELPFMLFPSIWAILNLTIFLLNFRDISNYSNLYFSIEILSYFILALKFINDVFIYRRFSYSHIFFLLLTILNLIIFRSIALCAVPTPSQEKVITALSFQGFLLREHTITEAGIEGYFGMQVFSDYITGGIVTDVLELDDSNTKFLSMRKNDPISDHTKNTYKRLKVEEASDNKILRSIFPKYNK